MSAATIQKRDADGVFRDLEEPHPYRVAPEAPVVHTNAGAALWDAIAKGTGWWRVAHPSLAEDIRQAQERERIAAPLPTKHPLAAGTKVWCYAGSSHGVAGVVVGSHFSSYAVREDGGCTHRVPERHVTVFDPHWNEKRAYRQGKTIQCRGKWTGTPWVDCTPGRMGVPVWNPNCEYRVKPSAPAKPPKMKRVEHWSCRFDRALRAGVTVQFRETEDHAWQDVVRADGLSYCYGENNYRVKPEPEISTRTAPYEVERAGNVVARGTVTLELTRVEGKVTNITVKEFT